MSVSQTAEGRASFIRDAQEAYSHMAPLGAIVGMVTSSVFVESALTNYDGQQQAANQVSALERQNQSVHRLIVKASGHPAVEGFLHKTMLGNNQQIHEIQASAPPHAGAVEDLSFIGGGALVGSFALSALLLTVVRTTHIPRGR